MKYVHQQKLVSFPQVRVRAFQLDETPAKTGKRSAGLQNEHGAAQIVVQIVFEAQIVADESQRVMNEQLAAKRAKFYVKVDLSARLEYEKAQMAQYEQRAVQSDTRCQVFSQLYVEPALFERIVRSDEAVEAAHDRQIPEHFLFSTQCS